MRIVLDYYLGACPNRPQAGFLCKEKNMKSLDLLKKLMTMLMVCFIATMMVACSTTDEDEAPPPDDGPTVDEIDAKL